jgi:hypothetical protein
LFDGPWTRSVLPFDLQIEESEMASEIRSWTRQGEEACLKLTWVEGEHGDGLPCAASVHAHQRVRNTIGSSAAASLLRDPLIATTRRPSSACASVHCAALAQFSSAPSCSRKSGVHRGGPATWAFSSRGDTWPPAACLAERSCVESNRLD